MSASTEQIFEGLYLIRRVEEEIARIYPSDKIKSPVHLSIGMEATSVAVCAALEARDRVFGSYRGHALYLAKGGDLKKFMAELYGRGTGVAKGKGGSMHLVETEAGLMGTSAVVGTTIPHACGFAYAQMLKKKDVVTGSFFGDGATEEGVFYESLNFAALKKLPVLFVCENNFYAIHSPLQDRHASPILDRVKSFGIPAERVEDGDVFKIRDTAERMVKEIRAGKGPRFLETVAYRWKEHVGPNEDFQVGYRKKSDAEPWMFRDPVKVAGSKVEESKRKAIEARVEKQIAEAIDFAEKSPEPDPKELWTDMYGTGTGS
jgi:TPP-dependent pyruvate/acetoin dehydrogenase alpha subunit